MRKLLVLAAACALVTSSSGCCGCLGKVRNWFHKGSPCGTAMAPAMIGAPLTMAAPGPMMVSAPVQCMESAPMCMPCDPCTDPCAGGYSTGYSGGMMMGEPVGCSNCGDGAVMGGETYVPTVSAPATLSPQPADGSRYLDPRPQ